MADKEERKPKYTYAEAEALAKKAQAAFNKAKTKEEVVEVMKTYGSQGIGYRPLCKLLFSGMAMDKALKAYAR